MTTRGGIIAPAAANFFRPNAPNYFLVQALTGGAVTPAVLNGALAASGTLRTPGVISPFGSVNAQSSDGNSNYNALNVSLKRRFANNFQFLASSFLVAFHRRLLRSANTARCRGDNRDFRAERSDALFDQRHRFVSVPYGLAVSLAQGQRRAAVLGRLHRRPPSLRCRPGGRSWLSTASTMSQTGSTPISHFGVAPAAPAPMGCAAGRMGKPTAGGPMEAGSQSMMLTIRPYDQSTLPARCRGE